MLIDIPKHSETASNDSTLDLVFLGNSYTSNNQLHVRVNNLLDAAGFDPEVQAFTSGGKTLAWHGEQAETEGSEWYDALRTPHDFILLQDQSQVPGFPTTTSYWQDSLQGAEIIDGLVDDNGGDTFFVMTWGYRFGDEGNSWRYPDYETMQNHLQTGYLAYAENLSSEERPAFIAPVGLAFENIFNSLTNATEDGTIFSDLYASDGKHPSIQGTYLAACVIHVSVTGTDSVGLPSTGGINATRTLELQQWADHTVLNTSGLTYPWQLQDLGVEFGVDSGSIFNIESGLAIGIAANFTNLAEVNTTALIEISGPEGWGVSWDYPTSPEVGHSFEAPSDVVQWMQFTVTAPEVSAGYPLANSIHDFSVSLVGDHTGNEDWWNFSLRYGEFNGMQIIVGGGTASIDPGGVVDLEFVLQNIGNSINSLGINIAALHENGSPVEPPSLSFAHEGWTAIVYDRAGLEDMNPGEMTTVRMQVQSPISTSGRLDMMVQFWAEGVEEVERLNQSVSIVPRSGGELVLTNVDCMFDVSPGESCFVELYIENTGDAAYLFNLSVAEKPDWLVVNITNYTRYLGPGQTVHGIDVSAWTAIGLAAGLSGEVRIELEVDGWIPAEVTFDVSIDAVHAWEIVRSDAEVMDGRLTGYWEVKNIGNSPDGLVVSVECTDFTGFGVLAPWDDLPDEETRSFEILNVPIDGTVLFEVWMDVPEEVPIATDAILTVEVRSVRDPSVLHIVEHSAQIDGEEPSDPSEPDEPSAFSKFMQRWLQTILIVIVSIVGTVAVAFAIRYRIEVDREYYRSKNPQVVVEEVGDWMSKFEEGDEETPEIIESQTTDSASFKQEFMEKSGDHSREVSPAPDSEVIDEAGDVLDEAQAEDAIFDAIEIADQLQESDIIHPDNIVLDLDDFDEKLDSLGRELRDDEDP
ncbi:MAG: hypothetical protein VX653_04480 [Candidatus Thermoplasmatota archaeon]|nr:hypothetical protein [Candidatus Thermoplasmatota archaeon]